MDRRQAMQSAAALIATGGIPVTVEAIDELRLEANDAPQLSDRTHVQFSGSLQPRDAEHVIAMLEKYIGRRPAGCGAFLKAEALPSRRYETVHVAGGTFSRLLMDGE